MNGPSTGNMRHYKGIEGLGGWLAILQIFLYISFVPLVLQLLIANSAMHGEFWPMFAQETSEYFVPEWRDFVRYGVYGSLVQMGALLYVLYLFYGKKRVLPKIMIGYLVLVFLLNLGDLYLLGRAQEAFSAVGVPEAAAVQPTETDEQESVRTFIRSLVGCAIWIPYFLKSERVENTFVR